MSSTHSAPSTQDASKPPPPVQEDNENADCERNYQPKSLKFWLIIGGMYAAIFLVALDRMIIATAIPHITDEFHSIEDIGWYGGAYMLTCAIFIPFSGRIYQLYSTKWVYLLSISIFEVGSALCGAAPSSIAFIIGRAIAGIGAAGIFSGGIMIMVPLVPLRKRPIFNSFFGMAFGVSSVLGPLVGGSFADSSKLTWRWCFYINLPIGGFTIIAMLLFLHLESPPREKLSLFAQMKLLDPLGLLFLVPSMVCLILALQWGGSTYSWSAPRIIVLLTIFAITFLLFLAVEVLTPSTAMAPTRVVLNRSVAGSMLFMFLLSGGLMAIVYYLSIWFQAAQGHSAMQAGIRTTPLVLSLVIFGIVAALVTEKLGYYVPVMLCGPVLCAVGAGMLSTLKPGAGSGQWISYQVIYGVGIGCGFSIANLGPQVALPRADVPLGMAMMFFTQQIGGAVFLAVSQNLFSHQLVERLNGIAGLDTKAIVNTGATALGSIVPPSELGTVIRAYSYALTRVFILSAALSACMILGALMVEWKSIKAEKSATKKDVEAGLGEGKSEAGKGIEKSGEIGEKELS
ncbi:putative MFS aflatoxin efflux pump [Lophium mytilinum]|uniref:Putative MFS aflatoxin efflux pump n=1 Tax=Lophium mytilinum TaxID=390894 RepID=A0A6A6RB22_9PEZI|nr:putative MFS aflatoxin efflux pump [Lophium mytilinum]